MEGAALYTENTHGPTCFTQGLAKVYINAHKADHTSLMFDADGYYGNTVFTP